MPTNQLKPRSTGRFARAALLATAITCISPLVSNISAEEVDEKPKAGAEDKRSNPLLPWIIGGGLGGLAGALFYIRKRNKKWAETVLRIESLVEKGLPEHMVTLQNKSYDEKECLEALWGLREIGRDAVDWAFPLLLRTMLTNKSPEVRYSAIRALDCLEPSDGDLYWDFMAKLRRVLRDPDKKVQETASNIFYGVKVL